MTICRVLCLFSLLTLLFTNTLSAQQQLPQPRVVTPATKEALKNLFTNNVKVTFSGDVMIVQSDGIPDHKTDKFPNQYNPNSILKQNYTFRIPLTPSIASTKTPTPFGAIGVALNGIPFFNQYNREGQDAVKVEVFDSCCGHPDPAGRYHYHKYPVCVKSPLKDTPNGHSGIIGFAFDGFAIYGPKGESGKAPKDLDDCNGHADSTRGYHYHVTEGYPYILGGYKGTPDSGNFPRGPGGGKRPANSGVGPPPNGQSPPPKGPIGALEGGPSSGPL